MGVRTVHASPTRVPLPHACHAVCVGRWCGGGPSTVGWPLVGPEAALAPNVEWRGKPSTWLPRQKLAEERIAHAKNIEKSKFRENQKHYDRRALSRKRYQAYCKTSCLQDYTKIATIDDYRNDLARGVFTFEDPQLWQLQHLRGADWHKLSSGGEEVDPRHVQKFI